VTTGDAGLDARAGVTVGEFVLDVDVQVGAGEILAVLGPNGAGKTTFLHVCAGLLPVDEGHVTIDGVVVDDPARGVFVAPEERSVGVVFQDYLLFPHLNALDNVAFGLREHGRSRHAARRQAERWLERVGMAGKQAARPAQLSGGEAQRVALARALAIEPSLLLLDEPLAALDVQTRAEIRRLVRDVLAADDAGGARILVTHDPVDALTLADRVAILQDGLIVQCDSPEVIVTRPRSAYVADLVGVNLFRGDAYANLITLDGGQQIVAADEHRGRVLAVVAPHSVALHRSRPDGSARNVWPGVVDAVDRIGTRVRVRVGGALPIVAEVTPAAVNALDLREGSEIWTAVKATEVEVYPE
jgi:molybdate transport system ATP-binding protein